MKRNVSYYAFKNEQKCKNVLMKLNTSLLTEDGELLKKYIDCEPVYNEKYLKTKIESYEGNRNVNFYDDGRPEKASHCICLSLIVFITNILFLKWVKTVFCKCFQKNVITLSKKKRR